MQRHRLNASTANVYNMCTNILCAVYIDDRKHLVHLNFRNGMCSIGFQGMCQTPVTDPLV